MPVCRSRPCPRFSLHVRTLWLLKAALLTGALLVFRRLALLYGRGRLLPAALPLLAAALVSSSDARPENFSLLLFTTMLVRLNRSVTMMVLVGVLLGGLFRGLSSFMQRLLDPEAFIILSDRFFADFTGADPRLLAVSATIVTVCSALAWCSRNQLDVVALGRDLAIGLGVDHRRASLRILLLVSILVGTSTALVGPTMFFGLLVVHLAYRLVVSHRHALTLPAAALVGVTTLVAGQLLFERILGFEGSLSMVVEFVGGITFLVLLLRQSKGAA